MVPKYTEYFLIQRIAKLNRQQNNSLTETRVVFIAGDTLRHQPMGSWSHDCSSSAGLLDSYPALVLYLAGVALHQQPMGSRSHDCSSYVGCGEFRVLYWCRPMPACISGNKRWHPDGYLIWCPRTGFRPAQWDRSYGTPPALSPPHGHLGHPWWTCSDLFT